MSKVKEFVHDLTHQDRIRYRIDTRPLPDADWTYAVQLECSFGDTWHAVIRYDDAHGRPHIDTLHPDGSQDKEWLSQKERQQSILEARLELSHNFTHHRERYRKELEVYERGNQD